MIVALVVGLAIPLFAQLSRDAAIAKAEAILKNLQDGKTAEIVKDFDARLTQDLPVARAHVEVVRVRVQPICVDRGGFLGAVRAA